MSAPNPENKGWSDEYYALSVPIEKAIEALHQYDGIEESDFDLSIDRGFQPGAVYRFTRLAFDLTKTELEKAPADISKLFSDLGLDELSTTRINLTLDTPSAPNSDLSKRFLVNYTPRLHRDIDQYGIKLYSDGFVSITPNKIKPDFHITFPGTIIDGDTDKAKMLQKVYMEGLQRRGSMPHPFVSRMLAASGIWLPQLIEDRRKNKPEGYKPLGPDQGLAVV